MADLVHVMPQIQRMQKSPVCLDAYREAWSIAEKIGDAQRASIYAYNVANALTEIDEIRDLAGAEQWSLRSMQLISQEDRAGRAQCLDQLGAIALARFFAEAAAGRKYEDCYAHLARAEDYCKRAISTLPPSAIGDLALFSERLGVICANSGRIDEALTNYRQAIYHYESMRNRREAGGTREKAAIGCRRFGRFADARQWAQSALRDYQACENAD
jgi:hypothetical protein